MKISSKTWRRQVLWPRLASWALAAACAWALLSGLAGVWLRGP